MCWPLHILYWENLKISARATEGFSPRVLLEYVNPMLVYNRGINMGDLRYTVHTCYFSMCSCKIDFEGGMNVGTDGGGHESLCQCGI